MKNNPHTILNDFHEVSEQLIQSAADSIGGNNAFRQLLINANLFRKANTNPIFLMNSEQTACFVTCRETYLKRLH